MLALVACFAATSLVAAPAGAQEEQPPPEPLTLDVARYVVPKTREKLIERGVQVKAKCNLDCVIVVKLKLPPEVAKELGIEKRVIGSGAAGAKAEQFRWVRARINKGAGRLLEDFEGGGNLEIRIRALP